MFQSQKLVSKWYQPIEILTATAAIYIVFIFLVSMGLNWVAGSVRRRYGLGVN